MTRQRGRWVLPLLLAAAGAWAAPADAPDPVLQARALAGRDPQQAHQALAALRGTANARHDLATRLFVDEADCRVLSDSSAVEARRIAAAGLAAAASAPRDDRRTRLALLRLQACAGGTLLDLGQQAQGTAELEAVLAQSARDAAFSSAHALALLERGLHRSRRGELVQGQEDLLAACQALETPVPSPDLELCRSHLANHYKRMGDTGEALKLLDDLLDSARRRGAPVDAGIYVFGIAQVRFERQEWDASRAAFEEAARLAEATHDRSGVAYAEYGLGQAALRLGRAQGALQHARRALALLADGSDPMQQLRTTLLETTALSALGQARQAAPGLQRIEPTVRASKDDALLAEWLATDADVQARLGAWREAYQAMAEWRPLNARAEEQKLSEQSARLRLQFNRERDVAELATLRQLNTKGDELVRTQRVAIALFVALLAVALAYAVHKLRHARHLQRLALLDELTGLPNRRAMLAHLGDELRRAQQTGHPLALLMVDIDHFKRVNDQHGHATGDEVLRQVARSLAAAVRQQDRAGRLGGEEFMVVLHDTAGGHARAVAERMRAGVAAATAPPVTVSIGLATFAPQDTGAALMARADEALYAAKAQGRDRIVESPAKDQRA